MRPWCTLWHWFWVGLLTNLCDLIWHRILRDWFQDTTRSRFWRGFFLCFAWTWFNTCFKEGDWKVPSDIKFVDRGGILSLVPDPIWFLACGRRLVLLLGRMEPCPLRPARRDNWWQLVGNPKVVVFPHWYWGYRTKRSTQSKKVKQCLHTRE